MKFFSFLFFVGCIALASAQTIQKEYLYETNDDLQAFKKKHIKKMTAIVTRFKEGEEGETYNSEIWHIDKDGYIEKYEDLDWHRDLQESWTETYFYDDAKNLVKLVVEIQGYKPDPEIEETHYAYNSKGLLDSICEFHVEGDYLVLDSCEHFFYDEKNRLTHTGSKDGQIYDRYEYLSNGDAVKNRNGSKTVFKKNGEIEREYSRGNWVYTYSKKGQLIKSENKEKKIHAEFDYDKYGLPKEYRSYENSQLKLKETYSFEYYENK